MLKPAWNTGRFPRKVCRSLPTQNDEFRASHLTCYSEMIRNAPLFSTRAYYSKQEARRIEVCHGSPRSSLFGAVIIGSVSLSRVIGEFLARNVPALESVFSLFLSNHCFSSYIASPSFQTSAKFACMDPRRSSSRKNVSPFPCTVCYISISFKRSEWPGDGRVLHRTARCSFYIIMNV